MAIRNVLNRNPVLTGVLVLVVAVGAGWLGIRGAMPPREGTEVYFTADGGKTYFAGDMRIVTPYTKDGKEVVRAYVYQCKDGKPFVAYLARQNPNAAPADSGSGSTAKRTASVSMGAPVDVKKPGDAAWQKIRWGDMMAMSKLVTICPGGTIPDPVAP